jgi:hypothetical protein
MEGVCIVYVHTDLVVNTVPDRNIGQIETGFESLTSIFSLVGLSRTSRPVEAGSRQVRGCCSRCSG